MTLYQSLGNHEADISVQDLQRRFDESNFIWLNSNMPNIPLTDKRGGMLIPHKTIEVKGKDNHTRRVVLGGYCTADSSCLKDDRFGGCVMEPVNPTVSKQYVELKSKENFDAFVPLTHQLITDDRELAKMKLGIPLILGGHEHQIFNELIEGCQIFKAGADIKSIGIIDLIWDTPETVQPLVKLTLKNATDYPKDQQVEELVQKHKSTLKQLVRSGKSNIKF